MTEIEKINKYIERTKIDEKTCVSYGMKFVEFEALPLSNLSPFELIHIAFTYGLAKGYRAGIREAKRV